MPALPTSARASPSASITEASRKFPLSLTRFAASGSSPTVKVFCPSSPLPPARAARILHWVKQYDPIAASAELPPLVKDQIERGVSPSLENVLEAAKTGDPRRIAALRRQALRAIGELAGLGVG